MSRIRNEVHTASGFRRKLVFAGAGMLLASSLGLTVPAHAVGFDELVQRLDALEKKSQAPPAAPVSPARNDETKAKLSALERRVEELASRPTSATVGEPSPARSPRRARKSASTKGLQGAVNELAADGAAHYAEDAARFGAVDARIAAMETAEVAQNEALKAAGNPSLWSGLSIKGFVDSQYSYNAKRPMNQMNALRVFDNRANTFRLNNLELDLSKAVAKPGDSGFRLVTNYGPDANVIASAGTGAADEFDVQQAYAEWIVGTGTGVDIKMGKFATLHGAEVIEARDNDQISRGFLFGFAIPFTHTGVRASHTQGKWSWTLGLNNGWDNLNDTNQDLAVEGSVGYAFCPRLTLNVCGMGGPEQILGVPIRRTLVDTVLTWKPNDDWTVKLNTDWGRDAGVNGWNGAAWYLRYSHQSPWAVSYRGEQFKDLDGSRTGAAQKLTEHTGTVEYKFHQGAIARLEVRADKSNLGTIFNDRTGVGTTGNQSTVGLQILQPF